MKDGMNDLVSISPNIPAAAKAAVAEKAAAIKSGKVQVFTGPIKDQSGKIVVPAGTALQYGDPQIEGMNWFVQGVKGKIAQ